jgi:mannose-6-phosphate isomerase
MVELTKVDKPWGHFLQFILNSKCSVKILHINRGLRNSYQWHKYRTEYWYVLTGRIIITLNDKDYVIGVGHDFHIPKRHKHRILAVLDSDVLEISIGKFDENDITRIEDDFGRVKDV